MLLEMGCITYTYKQCRLLTRVRYRSAKHNKQKGVEGGGGKVHRCHTLTLCHYFVIASSFSSITGLVLWWDSSHTSHTYYTNNSLAYLLLSPQLQGWSCGGTALILATHITPITALLTFFFLLNYRVGPVVGQLSY